MTINVHFIDGRHESGKTMILLGALERMQREGFATLYVVDTHDKAREAAKRTTITCTFAEAFLLTDDSHATAIGLDLNADDQQLTQKAIDLLAKRGVATFLLMTRSVDRAY